MASQSKFDLIPKTVVLLFFIISTLLFFGIIGSVIPSILERSFDLLSDFRKNFDVIYSATYNTLVLLFGALLIQCIIVLFATFFFYRIPAPVKLLLIMPYACGMVAPASAMYVFFSSALGPFNTRLLSDPWGLRLIIDMVDSWQWSCILLLACYLKLEEIPSSHFDQIRMSGSSKLEVWYYLIWPKISRIISIFLVVRSLDWLRKVETMKIFGSEGGPGYSVETLGMYITKNNYYQTGGGFAALLLLLQLILMSICLYLVLNVKLSRWIDNED